MLMKTDMSSAGLGGFGGFGVFMEFMGSLGSLGSLVSAIGGVGVINSGGLVAVLEREVGIESRIPPEKDM
jgi:hypothetical protein